MKITPLLIAGFLVFASCENNSSNSESADSAKETKVDSAQLENDSRISVAREYFLSEMLRPKSFELLEFKKTNSYEKEENGITLYVLEWEVGVYVGEDILTKASNKTGVSYSFTGSKFTFTSKGDNMFDCWENIPGCQWKSIYRKLYPGSLIQFTGDCYLQNTENGWRIYDRHGGVYKTFEIISEADYNNDNDIDIEVD